MNVYIVLGGYNYEGEQIIGVYSTRELAQGNAEVQKEDYDWTSVAEHEVDQK